MTSVVVFVLYIVGFAIRRSTGMSVVHSRLLYNSQALLYRLYIYQYIGCALLVQCRFFRIGFSLHRLYCGVSVE